MKMMAEKLLVGVLGLTLFASVMVVGYVDTKFRQRAKKETPPTVTANLTLGRGRELFEKYSCVACHGIDAKGGITNLNAKTAQQVPGLTFVAESYSTAELEKKILDGVADVQKLNTNGATPPLSMPAYRPIIAAEDLPLLVKYLDSLMPPKAAGEW